MSMAVQCSILAKSPIGDPQGRQCRNQEHVEHIPLRCRRFLNDNYREDDSHSNVARSYEREGSKSVALQMAGGTKSS
jgi:hypothetical protein